MAKQQIEVDIPDGYEFVRLGVPATGEYYLKSNGEIGLCGDMLSTRIVVRKVEPWRVPTKLDLLNRDSIPCRVKLHDSEGWTTGAVLQAVTATNSHRFYASGAWWRYCEIRDTEPRPAEFWTVKNTTGEFFGMYRSKNEAKEACIDEWSVVHFVEVSE